MKDREKANARLCQRKLATLIGAGAGGVMLTTDVTSSGVALDSIGQDLNATFADLQWVVNAFNLTFGAFLLTAGSLADLLGRRRMFTLGVILFNVAAMMCGFSQSSLMLNFSRALEGIGAAFLFPTSSALVAYEFRGVERAQAYSFLGASFGVGLAIGPLLSGVLTSWLSWRWIFLINVPVGLGILVLAVPRMGESRDPGAHRVDWAGLIAFMLSLTLFLYALIEAPEAGLGSPLVAGALLGTLVFGVLFLLVEQRQPRPMFDLALFRKPTFVAISLLPLAFSCGFVALLVYIPLYFQGIKEYSPLQAGLVMLPLTIPVFVVPFIISKLTTYLPARILLSAGLGLIGLGALWMSQLETGTSTTVLLSGLVLTGIGAGTVSGLMEYVAVSVVPAERSGMAAGMFSTIRLVSSSTAIAGIGTILISLTQNRLLRLIVGTSVAADERVAELANRVTTGDLIGAAASVTAAEREAFVQAATQSYTSALTTVFGIIASISFVCAVLVLALVRARDLVEESAPKR
ncbi:MAG: MFS transporter [Cyanobacteria bacterium]|nr:MFS transporter [Cyanobacteria bacterium GSL.Bin1]